MKNKFDLTGRVAIITGASGGMGTEIVKELASQGCNIAALDMVETAYADEIEKEYGIQCLPVICDITKAEEIKAAIELIL